MLTYQRFTEALNAYSKMRPSEGFYYRGANKPHVLLGELPYYVETFEIDSEEEMYDFVLAIIGYALFDTYGWSDDDIKEASYELYVIATSDDDDEDDESLDF